MSDESKSELMFYQTQDGQTRLEVRLINETVWLSLNQMAELFQRDKSVISKHIRNVFAEGELKAEATVAEFATVQTEGVRGVSRDIEFFNLDVIISVCYRVKSHRGTQFRITKLADDRAEQLRREPDRVGEEIRRRVREELRSRGEFPKIHPFPNNSGDVPDEMEVRLVVLDVEKPYAKEGTNLALEAAKEFLVQRGNSPRIYQNTLVFLAPDRSRLDELEQAARYYLAWQSIVEQETELNLDKSQSRQAATQKATWDRTTTSRIGETYQWLLVPTQPNPQVPLEWGLRFQISFLFPKRG